MKNIKSYLISSGITLLVGFIMFYLFLPSLNIHNIGFWFYLIILISLFAFLNTFRGLFDRRVKFFDWKKIIPYTIPLGIMLIIAIVIFINSPLFMANKYYNRITIDSSKDFKTDIEEVDFNSLALLDKSSSQKLGDRVMGQMSELVSQFDVSSLYTQINYNNDIVRVTPLEYS